MKPYAYHCRPKYGPEGSALLLEFVRGPESPEFKQDLLDALDLLEAEWGESTDMWLNDEVWTELWTRMGLVTYTQDIWNIAFILGDDNQMTIEVVDGMLCQHEDFEKIEVDFALYRRSRPA